jgi:hypothetical protein
MRRTVRTLRRPMICTLALMTLGCAGQPELDSPEIAQSLAAQAASSDTIRLAEIAPFAWDRVCILGPYGEQSRARKLVGFRLPEGAYRPLEESENLLIFANHGALARYTRVRRENDMPASADTCTSKEEAVYVRVSGRKGAQSRFDFAESSR